MASSSKRTGNACARHPRGSLGSRKGHPQNPPQIVASPWLEVTVRFQIPGPETARTRSIGESKGSLSSVEIANEMFTQTGWTQPADWRMKIHDIKMWGDVQGHPISIGMNRLGTGATSDPVSVKTSYGNYNKRAYVQQIADGANRVVQLTKAGGESVLFYDNSSPGAGEAVLDVHLVFRPLVQYGIV